ncbi:hypothetical protein [Helicobacter pylori]|uniref:hypothetical protein n=1 Tax=Helicobacter pylori TaxID=210 RepID=UPI00026A094C|nr:hypothetical protein [Helicobacter pylori]EJB48370.1 hypothetical protein HPHPA20_1144 [Helicobacter pylori Hp A-20]
MLFKNYRLINAKFPTNQSLKTLKKIFHQPSQKNKEFKNKEFKNKEFKNKEFKNKEFKNKGI